MEYTERLLINTIEIIVVVDHKAHAGRSAHSTAVEGGKVHLSDRGKILIQQAFIIPLPEQFNICPCFTCGHIQNQFSGGIINDRGSRKGCTHGLGHNSLHYIAFSGDCQRLFHAVRLHGCPQFMKLFHCGGNSQTRSLPVFLVHHRSQTGSCRLGVDGCKRHNAAFLSDNVIIYLRILKQIAVVGCVLLQIRGQIHIHIVIHRSIVSAGIGASFPCQKALKEDVRKISGRNCQVELLRGGGLIRFRPVEAIPQILLQSSPEYAFIIALRRMIP